ncbi:GvpL/GvpF family gas vesicle protein [Nonomuraea longispora]|uniref:GvpL/GvpF family gas vesicle protein n=1 Tax=Nonomuraea longispora TaxID=1848320 RepID=A0A4R4N593_9ACTN|nr:GvpL/GvpF family gas vesicle protein [Nonomuraea longispora]TDC03991.1 GvpL/GvpF family gas vesicle protein [Nonomuraea longispora]
MTGEAGTYLYVVARDSGAPSPDGLTGVAGTPVRAVARAGLVAYVSTVPLSQFGEEPLQRSMEDLDWLDETARAHHHVVEAVASAVPAVPVRLVTVYSGDEQVAGLLEDRHDAFRQALERITGRQEWGVKVYADPAEQAEPAAAQDRAGAATGPGAAYLRKRQAGLRSREEAWRRASVRAEQVHERLASVAVAGRRHRAQDPQLSGRKEWMVLNGAYLVDEERHAEFVRAVDELRREGGELELTGPWAPYSFATLDEAGEP